LTPDGRITYANDAWLHGEATCALFGPDLAAGVNYVQAIRTRVRRPDEPAAIVAAAIDYVLSGHRSQFETDYSEGNEAERRWYRVRAVRAPGEKPAVVVVYEDVTAYKLTEQALQHR